MTAQTNVAVDPGQITKSSWADFAVRIAFGGVVSVVAYFVGQRFGPSVAGLFLAFPAIMPATVTLVEKHAGQGKAVSEARGTVAGTIGLLAFGLSVWLLSPHLAGWLVLVVAAIGWLAASLASWLVLEGLMEETHDTESN